GHDSHHYPDAVVVDLAASVLGISDFNFLVIDGSVASGHWFCLVGGFIYGFTDGYFIGPAGAGVLSDGLFRAAFSELAGPHADFAANGSGITVSLIKSSNRPLRADYFPAYHCKLALLAAGADHCCDLALALGPTLSLPTQTARR